MKLTEYERARYQEAWDAWHKTTICSVFECNRPILFRKLCSSHFYKQRNATPKRRAQRAAYWQSEEGKKARERNEKSPKRKRTHRNYLLEKKYGLSIEEFERRCESQGHRCAGCDRLVTETGKKGLAVDHDHITGKLRGLLCPGCNLILGHAKDNPARLSDLIAYLDKWKDV